MQRTLQSTLCLRTATRQLSSSPCWCQSNSTSDPSSSTPAYSLPLDAFSSHSPPIFDHTPPPSRSNRPPKPHSRQRQRQNLTDAEAHIFANLLGEILPRSVGSGANGGAKGAAAQGGAGGGMFDVLNAVAGGRGEGVERVQEALLRKSSKKLGQVPVGVGMWERKARHQLTHDEEMQLDRLREELMHLPTDREVLQWGMRVVFDLPSSNNTVFPSPSLLASSGPPPLPRTASQPDNLSQRTFGPSSRIYPDLLLLLFLVLRDTHHSPSAALSLFSLAASNPYSYITGCTSVLYTEVLRTRWAQGDVESVLSTLEEMRGSGLKIDDKAKDLIRAIGEAVRIDGERAELRVEHLLSQGELSLAPAPETDQKAEVVDETSASPASDALASSALAASKDRLIERARFFGEHQRAAWARMETLVQESDEELEAAKREHADDKRREEFAGLAKFAEDFPGVPPRRVGGGPGGGGVWEDEDSADPFRAPYAPPPKRSISPYDEPRSSSSSSSSSPYGRFAEGGGYDFTGTRHEPKVEWDDRGDVIMPKRPSFANPYKIRRKGLTREEKGKKDVKHPALWWKN